MNWTPQVIRAAKMCGRTGFDQKQCKCIYLFIHSFTAEEFPFPVIISVRVWHHHSALMCRSDVELRAQLRPFHLCHSRPIFPVKHGSWNIHKHHQRSLGPRVPAAGVLLSCTVFLKRRSNIRAGPPIKEWWGSRGGPAHLAAGITSDLFGSGCHAFLICFCRMEIACCKTA